MTTATRPRSNVSVPTKTHPSLGRLRTTGHYVEPINREEFHVNGVAAFWPATNYWRALDGSERGYGLRSLMQFTANATARASA